MAQTMIATPAFHLVAPEQRLTFARVVAHALPEFRLVIVGLLFAALVALALVAAHLVRRRVSRPERTLAFLTALIRTGPLAASTIAAYDILKVATGLVNVRPTPGLVMLAPAFAEAAMALFIGLFAAAVASAAKGCLETLDPPTARTSGT